jgi:hypothetical protein
VQLISQHRHLMSRTAHSFDSENRPMRCTSRATPGLLVVTGLGAAFPQRLLLRLRTPIDECAANTNHLCNDRWVQGCMKRMACPLLVHVAVVDDVVGLGPVKLSEPSRERRVRGRKAQSSQETPERKEPTSLDGLPVLGADTMSGWAARGSPGTHEDRPSAGF